MEYNGKQYKSLADVWRDRSLARNEQQMIAAYLTREAESSLKYMERQYDLYYTAITKTRNDARWHIWHESIKNAPACLIRK